MTYGFTDDTPTLDLTEQTIYGINDVMRHKDAYITRTAEVPLRVRLTDEQLQALEREATMITGKKQKIYKGDAAFVAGMEIIFDEMGGL